MPDVQFLESSAFQPDQTSLLMAGITGATGLRGITGFTGTFTFAVVPEFSSSS